MSDDRKFIFIKDLLTLFETTPHNTKPLNNVPYEPLIESVDFVMKVIENVRKIRNQYKIKQKEPLMLFMKKSQKSDELISEHRLIALLKRLGFVDNLEITTEEPESTVAFVEGAEKFFVKIEKAIDVEAEIVRLTDEAKHAKQFLISVEKKLSNERFVSSAPAAVVEKERQKLADGQARLKSILESLNTLKQQ